MFPLNTLMRRFIKRGRLRIIDCDGKVQEFGEPDAPLDVAIALRDPDTARRISLHPALSIGEAFMDGALTIEEGTLLDFLRLLILNNRRWTESRPGKVYYGAEDFFRLPQVFNPPGRSSRNVKHHYDLSSALFSTFLDTDRQYSCAYYRSDDDDLETAQLRQEAAYRRQAGHPSGTARTGYRFGLGRAWRSISQALSRARDRADAVRRAVPVSQ